MLQTFLVGVIIWLAVWLLSTPFRYGLWKIPGPWWRKLTDLFQVLDVMSGSSIRALQESHAKYGNVVQVGPSTVSLSDPEMVAVVYGTHSILPKSYHWETWRMHLNGKAVPSIVAAVDRKTHAILKRPIAGIYSMSNVIKSEPFLDSSIIEFVRILDEKFISGENKGRNIAMGSWLYYFSYDAIMNLLLSKDFGLTEDGGDTHGIFRNFDKARTFRAVVFSMPWLNPLFAKLRVEKLFGFRFEAFQLRARSLIEARMTEGRPDPSREDLLYQFLETQKTHPKVVNDLVLNGYVVGPILAGLDSTSVMACSVVYYLGRYPSVAAKLHAELKASKLSMPAKWAEIQQLPYLGAVMKETLRIHPVSAFFSRRQVPPGNGLVLPDGRVLPPGTTVGISPGVVHLNREVFGNDAKTFNPDRWLRASNESDTEYENRLRNMTRADISFGQGDRVCIGQYIAKSELYKLVATLYLVFDITLVEPIMEWKVEESIIERHKGLNVRMSWKQGANLASLRSC